MDNISRLSENDYIPNDKDILMLRVQTTGINEIQFLKDAYEFRSDFHYFQLKNHYKFAVFKEFLMSEVNDLNVENGSIVLKMSIVYGTCVHSVIITLYYTKTTTQ